MKVATAILCVLFLTSLSNSSNAQGWFGIEYGRGMDIEENTWGLTAGASLAENWGLGADLTSYFLDEVTLTDTFGYAFYTLEPEDGEGFYFLLPYVGAGRTCAQVITDGETSKSCQSGFTFGGKLIMPLEVGAFLGASASYISGGNDGRLRLGLHLSIGNR